MQKKIGHHVPDDFPAPVRALAALSRGLAVLEGIGIAASLATLILLATWQFTTRNLRMGGMSSVPSAPAWTDNVLRHAVFLTGFMGAMFASFTARHLRIDAVTRLAGPRARLALRVVATVAACFVAGVVVWAALKYRTSVGDEIPEEGQIFTAGRSALVIIVGLCGIIFHFTVQVLIDATYLFTGREIPDYWIAEASHGGEPIEEEFVADPDVTAAGDEKAVA